jgi:tetratricopeptide (TPR) repeat protein
VPAPRVVVIPFGVPAEGRGLGLGLAALVHAFVHVDGSGVALAQLHGRAPSSGGAEPGEAPPPSPVEAFVSPDAWRDISGRGDAPGAVAVVLTGSFEPPIDGAGTIHLLAFDVQDGRTRARVDASLEGDDAGATLVNALEQFGSGLGGEIGGLRDLRDLGWESLESVLRAERCALHDPTRGGPHDRLAAMLHLGRAIGDAPKARYPAGRLALLAMEVASGPAPDPRLASAAVRALERATTDAPGHVELLEALAALHLRLGHPRDAERRMNEATAIAPARVRPHALLAQSLRAQGLTAAALVAIEAGLGHHPNDPLLLAERGVTLLAMKDFDAAAASWRGALARDPVHPLAFGSLAALALARRDVAAAQGLVDAALAESRATPDVVRRAVQLALSTEAQGLPRASRVARLCERLLAVVPDDAHASVALARAQITLGETAKARTRLAQVALAAPHSAAAAEAQVTQLAVDDPSADLELQSVLRAAHTAPVTNLADVAARARRLATMHNAWTGWLAAAVAERRRGRWVAARGALEVALETAPGAASAHAELALVLLEVDDLSGALAHARLAATLEPESPRVLTVLARTLVASGRRNEATEVVHRALALRPEDADADAVLALLARPAKGSLRPWTRAARRARDLWRRLAGR